MGRLPLRFCRQHSGSKPVDKPVPRYSDAPAASLRLPDYGLAPGCAANLVLMRAASVSEALTLLAPNRIVIRRGVVLARSTAVEEFYG